MRKGLLTKQEYELKYNGLEILYFKKKYFLKLGVENDLNIQIFDHDMPNFPQNPFRFDCLITKKTSGRNY